MNVWIGLEQREPRYEWWLNLSTGHKFETASNAWVPFTSNKVEVGEVVLMMVEGDTLSYKVGSTHLGVAFRSEKLRSGKVDPCVFVQDVPDKVHILRGATYQNKQRQDVFSDKVLQHF